MSNHPPLSTETPTETLNPDHIPSSSSPSPSSPSPSSPSILSNSSNHNSVQQQQNQSDLLTEKQKHNPNELHRSSMPNLSPVVPSASIIHSIPTPLSSSVEDNQNHSPKDIPLPSLSDNQKETPTVPQPTFVTQPVQIIQAPTDHTNSPQNKQHIQTHSPHPDQLPSLSESTRAPETKNNTPALNNTTQIPSIEQQQEPGEVEEEEQTNHGDPTNAHANNPSDDDNASSSSNRSDSNSDSHSSLEKTRREIDAMDRSDDEPDTVQMCTKNERDSSKLPVVMPNVTLLPSDTLLPLGKLSSLLGTAVIILTPEASAATRGEKTIPSNKANEDDSTALDEGSPLWFADRTMLGGVSEAFGPICAPMYSVRLSETAVPNAAARLGHEVFYAPRFAHTVRAGDVRGKGYDSSNMFDEEAGGAEFSDDELEAAARRGRKRAARAVDGAPKRGRGRPRARARGRGAAWRGAARPPPQDQYAAAY